MVRLVSKKERQARYEPGFFEISPQSAAERVKTTNDARIVAAGLKHEKWNVNREALLRIPHFRKLIDEENINGLSKGIAEKFLTHEDSGVREAAADSLISLGSKSTPHVLTYGLNHESKPVRDEASRILLALGRQVVPQVRKFVAKAEPQRLSAFIVLNHLGVAGHISQVMLEGEKPSKVPKAPKPPKAVGQKPKPAPKRNINIETEANEALEKMRVRERIEEARKQREKDATERAKATFQESRTMNEGWEEFTFGKETVRPSKPKPEPKIENLPPAIVPKPKPEPKPPREKKKPQQTVKALRALLAEKAQRVASTEEPKLAKIARIAKDPEWENKWKAKLAEDGKREKERQEKKAAKNKKKPDYQI
ncbi:MAG TPA: hypothetical protein VGQ00_03630 [Candidatus Norongarragalinales archaeon]|nr:hypothetical protein [Candidatus Norongarragalinales archaeon]